MKNFLIHIARRAVAMLMITCFTMAGISMKEGLSVATWVCMIIGMGIFIWFEDSWDKANPMKRR